MKHSTLKASLDENARRIAAAGKCAAPEADPFDDGWRDDEPECSRCHGDGMDPWCDYISPCPKCGGLET